MSFEISKRWIIFLAVFSCCGVGTWMSPIDFDSAFNFQVVTSLLDSFSYQSTYIPAKIYHDRITTNGPIQYAMALFVSLFGLDLGRSIGLGLIGGLTALIVYCYSRKAVMLYCLLLIFWPVFAGAHTSFCGEIFAIMMIVIGLNAWGKWRVYLDVLCNEVAFSPKQIFASHYLWVAVFAFGFAIATKLVVIAFIPILLICIFLTKNDELSACGNTHIVLMCSMFIPIVFSILVFLVQFSVSILHSGGNIYYIVTALKNFILAHINIANRTKEYFSYKDLYIRSVDMPVIAIMLMLIFVAFRKKYIFLLPLFCTVILLFVFHFNLRRLLPLAVPLMLAAIKAEEDKLQSNCWFHCYSNRLILFSSVFLVAWHGLFGSKLYLVDVIRQFSWSGASHNVAHIKKKQNNYDNTYNAGLLAIIKKIDGPIFTSGWWQFPEISLRTGVAFYDRLASENTPLLQMKRGFLLYSEQMEDDPSSVNSLCGNFLYKDGGLILCEYNPNGSGHPDETLLIPSRQ